MAVEFIETNRDRLTFDRIKDRDDLIAKNLLVTDPRRQRPHWFDGRFLAASDLRNEQNYFLLRQSDLGRAGGEGIVEGLLVQEGLSSKGVEVLIVEAGFGFTDAGELVGLPNSIEVVPSDVPKSQQLDAAFGLEVIPNDAGRSRSGLFVLALRPVEWTANPLAAYPTSLNGRRHSEDANIVEAAAVSLIPWPDEAGELSWARRRSRAAREIFVGERVRGVTTGTLPLALVALRGNVVEWVDPFLVRRELGADRREGLDFGFGRRPLREAHLMQYEFQLGELLQANPSAGFAANEQFDALPPAGRMPAGSVNAATLTQRYFPRGIDVAVSFVPEDEIPALLEESFLLPPLDLQAPEKALVGIAVLILAPLKRRDFNERRQALVGKSWQLAFTAPESKVEATPFELLFARTQAAEAAETRLVTTAGEADSEGEREWRELLNQAATGGAFWYVRRRHLPIDANVPGTSVDATPAARSDARALTATLSQDATLAATVSNLRAINRPEVNVLLDRIASPKLLANNGALLRGLLNPLSGRTATEITAGEAVARLAPAVDEKFGDGFARLPEDSRVALTDTVVSTGFVAETDALLRDVPEARLNEAVAGLGEIAKQPTSLRENLGTLRTRLMTP